MSFSKLEIGGNFNLYRSQLELSSCLTDHDLSSIFNRRWIHYTLTSSARGALSLLLDNWAPSNKTVILPDYLCDTEIIPFVYKNYKILYYRIHRDLSPDLDMIAELIDCNPYSCLYVQSYFGKDTLMTARKYFSEFRKKGIVIIEDQTQAWLSNLPTRDTDFFITSLRKWLEIPDGGMLSSQIYAVDQYYKRESIPELSNIFIEASMLKEKFYITSDESLKELFRPLYYKMNDIFSRDNLPHDMGLLSRGILAAADIGQIIRKRQENYLHLYNALKEVNFITSVIGMLNSGEVPLYFPIYIDDRNDFQRYMCSNKVYCPIIWPKPEQIKNGHNRIYDDILCIPCDQRYNIDDMEEIIRIINSYGI